MKLSEDDIKAASRVVGSRIQRLRTEAGKTQAQLEEETGIYDVGAIERGEGNPTLVTFLRLAKGLNLELSVLLSVEEASSEEEILVALQGLMRDRSLETQSKILDIARLLVK